MPPVLSSLVHRFEPADARPGKLLVVLHGRGDSMEGFAWLPAALALPGLTYLFFNAPDDYYGGYSWYELPPEQGPGVLRSRSALVTVLDELVAAGWQASDILLFGFSQGCLMALDVGARYPQTLAGVCGISGYMHFRDTLAAELQPAARLMPWWISAGTQDQVIAVADSAQAARSLTALGVPVSWHTYAKGHTIDPVRELPEVKLWLASALGLGQ